MNNDWLKDNVPHYTPTLHSRSDAEFWCSPVIDDFMCVGCGRAEMANGVYSPDYPSYMKELMKRVRKANLIPTPTFLTKIIHQLHARINQIYENKGDKIHPSRKTNQTK